MLSWHSRVLTSVTLPVLSEELDVLIAELNELSDDFVDGHLVDKVSVAQSFILKNFGDSQLSSPSFDLQSSLTAFAKILKTYTQDPFYSEYQMWAVYVSTRYWELQLLAGLEQDRSTRPVVYSAKTNKAANTFSFNYLNKFKPAHANFMKLKNGTSFHEPYKAQLADMALEFSITYASAQVIMIAANNKLYA